MDDMCRYDLTFKHLPHHTYVFSLAASAWSTLRKYSGWECHGAVFLSAFCVQLSFKSDQFTRHVSTFLVYQNKSDKQFMFFRPAVNFSAY
jgi:hypothetical protein